MRILGIDPGLSVTGYGIIEVRSNELRSLKYGGIRVQSKSDFSKKLFHIYNNLLEIIQKFEPDFCSIENIFYHQNKKTAIIMGHARGVAILAAAQHNLPVFEYSPREIKMSIVGVGAASKKQVQAMVKNILHLPEIPIPEDAADALAVALCHYHRLKFKQMVNRVSRES
ncbi:MAG: crossover junction endodeoxyribonuclease RuvC [Calditrichia bacterium]